MNIRVFPDAFNASIYAAAKIEDTIKETPAPVLGLATGGTMNALYQQLVHFHKLGLSFANVVTINLDEYVGLSPTDPNSYHTYMHENLFDHIDIQPANIHVPNGAADDLASACEAYDQALRQHPIDVQLLGIGVNGHIGFNEPGSTQKSKTHVVELAEETIQANARFFANPESVPTRAVTMGLQSILLAKHILLLAFGEEKAQAIREMVKGDISTSVPASLLQVHPNVTVVLDEPAAKLL